MGEKQVYTKREQAGEENLCFLAKFVSRRRGGGILDQGKKTLDKAAFLLEAQRANKGGTSPRRQFGLKRLEPARPSVHQTSKGGTRERGNRGQSRRRTSRSTSIGPAEGANSD